MRPRVCPNCAGSRTQPFTTRNLVCLPCKGTGITYVEGHDPWSRYRAAYKVPITPRRLAMEEALDEAGLGAPNSNSHGDSH